VGPTHRFYGPARIDQELAQVRQEGAEGQALAELITTYAWPNVIHDAAATQERRLLARDAVSRSIGRVLKGEKIIGAHERITADALRKLESYEYARQHRTVGRLMGGQLRAFGGRAMLLLMMLAGFVIYLMAYRRDLVVAQGDLLLLALTFAIFLLLGGLVLNGLQFSGYLIPVAGFAVMIALLYDERLALVATGFLSGIIGLVTSQGLAFVVVIGCGSVAAILSVHQLRDRRQLYRLLLYVPLVHIFALGALGMVTAMAFEEILADGLYLVFNPFIAAGLALFAVPLSESVFGRCTNLTLLELLDLNRPALRRLMLEAPGTYHHSLMVGTLAEAGASAIGANPLMARVQGYYHDIGKIRKPEYFIENQMAGRKNPHDKLAPAMSRLILESHVRDGMALAREFKLPRVVRDGIAQHHGTSLMTYFYHRARQKDPHTPATEYCYPGPRPRSRELAVVLLADQVDAASRSLEEPTSSRLRGLIKQLCEKRALEGELDESRLTLKDLADVREAFLPILTALFHGRVSYPSVEHVRGKVSAGTPSESPAKAEG
jgi:putative nucleotidyltransferase with HDIG domain